MNAKLDSGWKMTNMSCEECRFSLLTNLDSKEIYCPKCDDIKEDKFEYKKEDAQTTQKELEEQLKQIYDQVQPVEQQKQVEQIDQTEEIDFKEIFKSKKSDDISKKISEKLRQGWAMLKETCPDCLFPIMKSKKGVKMCCGCNYNSNSEQQSKVDQQKVKVEQEQQQQQQRLHVINPLSNQMSINFGQSQNMSEQFEQQFVSMAKILSKLIDYHQNKIDQYIEEDNATQVQNMINNFRAIRIEQNQLVEQYIKWKNN